MNLLIPESQPNYPYEDLSEPNAEILELLMQNRDIIRVYHDQAESTSKLFTLGHIVLDLNARLNIDESDRLKAFSNGVATYEIIESIVGYTNIRTVHDSPLVEAYFLDNAPPQSFVSIIDEARDKFSSAMPRAKKVVSASAARLHPNNVDYAVTGAAMMYLTDIDISADIQGEPRS